MLGVSSVKKQHTGYTMNNYAYIFGLTAPRSPTRKGAQPVPQNVQWPETLCNLGLPCVFSEHTWIWHVILHVWLAWCDLMPPEVSEIGCRSCVLQEVANDENAGVSGGQQKSQAGEGV